jgi:hypothetical protein
MEWITKSTLYAEMLRFSSLFDEYLQPQLISGTFNRPIVLSTYALSF